MGGAAFLKLLIGILRKLFGMDIVKKMVQVGIGVLVAYLLNRFFQGIHGLPGMKAAGNFNVEENVFPDIIDKIQELGGIDLQAGTDLKDLHSDLYKISPIFGILFTASYIGERMKSLTDIVSGKIYQVYAKEYRPNPPEPNLVLNGINLGRNIKGGVVDILKRNGISDDDITTMVASVEHPLGEAPIIGLLNKGLIDKEKASSQLQRLGYTPENADSYINSINYIPDLAMLMRFAESNVFNESDADTLGLDTGRPKEFYELVKSHGYSHEFSLYAWRSRFNMPPLSLFFEALNRKLIPESDKDVYYRAIGLPTGLYNTITKLAHPLLPVPYAIAAFQSEAMPKDMFEEILTEHGYEAVSRLLIERLAKGAKNSSVSTHALEQITAALAKGFVTEAVALGMYEKIGLTLAQAQMQVILANYTRSYDYNETVLTAIRNAFIRREINGSEAASELIHLGITNEGTTSYIQKWTIEAKVAAKVPSITQYSNMYKHRIINAPELVNGIMRNGYNAEDSSRIAALIIAEVEGETHG